MLNLQQEQMGHVCIEAGLAGSLIQAGSLSHL